VPAQVTAAIAGCVQEPHPAAEAVASGMVPRDSHRLGIDIAGDHQAMQALRGGDRQDAAAGADIERPAKASAPR